METRAFTAPTDNLEDSLVPPEPAEIDSTGQVKRRPWIRPASITRARKRDSRTPIAPETVSGGGLPSWAVALSEGARRWWHSPWVPALILTGFALPIFAGIATVLAYAVIAPPATPLRTAGYSITTVVPMSVGAITTAGEAGLTAVVFGLLGTAGAWLIFSFLCRPFVIVKSARPSVYEELVARLHRVDARLAPWHARAAAVPPDQLADGPYWLTAYREACGHREAIADALGVLNAQTSAEAVHGANLCGSRNGRANSIGVATPSSGDVDGTQHNAEAPPSVRWAFGSGYVTVWQRLHRAEEALIELDDASAELVSGALHDELRLSTSRLPHWEEWQRRLLLALATLDPAATRYAQCQKHLETGQLLLQAPAAWETSGPAIERTASQGAPIPKWNAPESDASFRQHSLAKALLRQIRRMLNECHDAQRERTIRLLHRSFSTIASLGVVTYLLIVLAVLMDVPRNAVAGATAYYLLGATAGLFGRIILYSRADTETDDYGLGTARLLEVPILSGLAAIVGVVSVALIVGMWEATDLTRRTNLAAVFDPSTENAHYLLVAVLFGLAPHARRIVSSIMPSRRPVEGRSLWSSRNEA